MQKKHRMDIAPAYWSCYSAWMKMRDLGRRIHAAVIDKVVDQVNRRRQAKSVWQTLEVWDVPGGDTKGFIRRPICVSRRKLE